MKKAYQFLSFYDFIILREISINLRSYRTYNPIHLFFIHMSHIQQTHQILKRWFHSDDFDDKFVFDEFAVYATYIFVLNSNILYIELFFQYVYYRFI